MAGLLGLLIGGSRESGGAEANDPTPAKLLQQLQDDPGKGLALIADSARHRGSVTQDEYLLALEALTKPVSWQVSAPLDGEADHGPVESVTFTPPLPQGAAASEDGARFWPQRKWLVWAWEDGTVAMLDLNSSGGPVVLSGKTSQFGGAKLLFSPDGRWLVKASKQANCQIWDVSSGMRNKQPKELIASQEQSQFNDTLFTQDSQFLVVHENLELVVRRAPTWEVYHRIPNIWQWTALPVPADGIVGSAWGRPIPAIAGGRPRTPLLQCTLGDKTCSELTSAMFAYRALIADPQTKLLALHGGADAQDLELRLPPYLLSKAQNKIEAYSKVKILSDSQLLIASGKALYRQGLSNNFGGRSYPFVGHDESILSTQVVRSGAKTWILSLGQEGAVHLQAAHQSQLERLIGRFQIAEDKIVAAALSPDGELVAGGLAGEGSVRLWFVQPGSGQRFEGSSVDMTGVHAHDARSLIIASGSHPADAESREELLFLLWQKSNPVPVHAAPLEMRKECLYPKSCFAGKDLIAAGGACDGIRFWRVGSNKLEREITGTGAVHDLVCLPNGDVVAAGPDGVRQFAAQGERRLSASAETRLHAQLSVSPRGDVVMAAWPGGPIQFWKTGDWSLSQATFPTPFRSAKLVDEQTAMVVDDKGEVWELPLRGGSPTRRPELGRASWIRTSRDGKLLAVGNSGRDSVRIGWRSGGRLHSLWQGQGLSAIEFSADGRSLLIAGQGAVYSYLLPPLDAKEFASWLASRASFAVEAGAMHPRPFPGLAAMAGR